MATNGHNGFNYLVANYLSQFIGYYPNILDWYLRIVESSDGRHKVFPVVFGREIGALSIVKFGRRGKLCHFSVLPSYRRFGLGAFLLDCSLGVLRANGSTKIYATVGVPVFREYGHFFCNFGFKVIDWEVNRYRRGKSELIWELDLGGKGA
jgi:GNAT superfamily N-acetyltransferase